jgi:hypothetical protein
MPQQPYRGEADLNNAREGVMAIDNNSLGNLISVSLCASSFAGLFG